MTTLSYQGKQFFADGQPIQLISGAVHYSRVVPEYWEDRLLKLKALGCNCVETYIAWNLHEPREGKFNFEGMADIAEFIRVVERVGLYVIVRPSPYICAEWEFGGLPAWLLKDEMRLRCSEPRYLDKVAAYYDALLPQLTPLLATNGGPIIAVQIENEYGSYGNDQAYLQALRQMLIERGIDVLLFTSDGPQDDMLQGGMAEGVLATVNFGSRVEEAFDKLKEYQPDGPLMCMEYWNGWFDHWFEQHHTRNVEDAAKVLDDMLRIGASVNFYMAHGGTNFGFWNGANHGGKYEPTVTSYDYDAAISEAGDITPKYHAFREVIGKYALLPEGELPANTPKADYGTVQVSRSVYLFDTIAAMADAKTSVCPEPMEKYGQNYGFIMYSTRISGPRPESRLTIQDVRDRALVFLDRKLAGIIERWDPKSIPVIIPEGGAQLDILVENMGRVNYGPELYDRKGITHGVRLNGQFLFHWEVRNLELETLDGVNFDAPASKLSGEQPGFYEATLTIEGTPKDTFLRLDGWKKGVVFINGFNLGRYWEAGPQQTLFVPAPILRGGDNHIVVFELHAAGNPLRFEAEPSL
ncbi:glycoside hydrolase family 35 protein [Paenibacillus apiarius]|uniref:Beta-galactosidase n=1 Tax=Paenibacillus apiarius TaxID=46240 RepID=A0ABT4DPM3_9BACL|nr:beta-galactosidase [Paenibacillus apiarius]MCY9515623.1 beta-galactosidase [Paenibacillus apiarius]MCY9519304.1 beta-galactosidase [Paenibacillus apiarius]MCY9550940.1 beta-galactosidase [Paenibacillus apiarius]MCY9558968.1 beta-galactosidase [Paenibacillus apiarius]MCY9683555.1 beta-galactosidase [Paenibacillus apiarius]